MFTYLHKYDGDRYAKRIPRMDTYESNQSFAKDYIRQWGVGYFELRDRNDEKLLWVAYLDDGEIVEHYFQGGEEEL